MDPLVISTLATRHPASGYALWDDAAALICRLAHDPTFRGGTTCSLRIDWRPAGSPVQTLDRAIYWGDESWVRLAAAEQYSVTHPEREVTGRAAVVMFALLIHELERLTVQRVLPLGSRGDYLVGQYVFGAVMAEVSGIRTTGGDTVNGRVRSKFRQIFDNPQPTEGFVSVTMFADAGGGVCSELRHSTRTEWEAEQ